MTKEQRTIVSRLYCGGKLDFVAYENYLLGLVREGGFLVHLFPINYSSGQEYITVISSRKFGDPDTHSVAWRALIHGEEAETGVATAANFLPMVGLCQLLGLEWAFLIAGNPQGAQRGKRYSLDYSSEDHFGNDDLWRFWSEEENRWLTDAVKKPFTTSRPVDLSIDKVPPETVAMVGLVREWGLAGVIPTLVGVLDFHVDEMIRGGGYYYGYGPNILKLQRFFHRALEKLQPRGARVLVSGAGDDGNGGDKVWVNKFGLVYNAHDGGMASAFAMMGVPLSMAVEIAGKEKLPIIIDSFGHFAQAWLLAAASIIPPTSSYPSANL